MAKKAAKKRTARKAARRTISRPKAPAVSAVKKSNRGGKPRFKPTPEDRRRVETLAGLGMKQEEICLLIFNPTTGEGIGEKTLRLYFETELATGAPKANALVAQSLFNRATKGEGTGAVTAAIWWTKIRMGWKERTVVEVETKSGVLITPAAMTPAQWIEAAQARAENATEPGAEENGNGMNGNGKSRGKGRVTR